MNRMIKTPRRPVASSASPSPATRRVRGSPRPDASERPRHVLAANLRALMAANPELGTLPKLTARSGVSNGTLDRIRRAAVATRVDELARLGRAFGIEAWEMLRPQGAAQVSPLGRMLGEHLDRAAGDEAAHRAAYAAAVAAIDRVAADRGKPARPAAEAPARPRRVKAKSGA